MNIVLITALLACTSKDATASYTGTIEVTEVQAASTLGGRLIEVVPDEGDAVKAGSVLFRVDSSRLEAEQALRTAGVAQAHAAEQAAEAQVSAAQAQVSTLQRELARVDKLASGGVATAQQASQLRGQLEVARAQLTAAQKMVEQARAGGDQANAGLAATQTALGETQVVAAFDGVVLSRNREPGEVVGPGLSVLTLGDLAQPRLRIYVPLVEVEKMEIGQTVPVHLDAADTRGSISRIASEAEFTPREILTPDERVKRVFAVDIALEPGPGIHPGMPAEAQLPEAR